MAGRVAGKKVFVTGAAQGLGAAIASAVAVEGGKVALADINAAGVEKLAGELNAAHGAGTASAKPCARWPWRSQRRSASFWTRRWG